MTTTRLFTNIQQQFAGSIEAHLQDRPEESPLPRVHAAHAAHLGHVCGLRMVLRGGWGGEHAPLSSENARSIQSVGKLLCLSRPMFSSRVFSPTIRGPTERKHRNVWECGKAGSSQKPRKA